MDVLTGLLEQAGLKKRILHQRRVPAQTSLEFPCGRSLGFHIVTHGEVLIESSNKKEPIVLKKGDVALMARGCHHQVRTLTASTFVSGAYQLWNQPVHPLFEQLPNWFVLKSSELHNFDDVQLALSLLEKELAGQELGRDSIIQGLLDIIFAHLCRRMLEKFKNKPLSWSKAIHDPQIRLAIEAMHEDCSKNWTLEGLAQKAGLSRAGFAAKFKSSMGDTPLQYLTTLRVQKAIEMLSNTDDKIETIAENLGYADGFSFSKVFKRTTGLSPKQFRLEEQQNKDLAYRFK